MKVLSSYSIKGGVGKTALAVNLSCYLAQRGLRVLLVDLDPQCAASFYFQKAQAHTFQTDSSEALANSLSTNIVPTEFAGLDLIPGNLAYRRFDLWIDGMKKGRKRWRRILQQLGKAHDAMILDCPPGITLLSESIFRASDLVIVPVIPTPLSVHTYEQLVAFFEDEDLPRNRILPFFSMVQRRRIHDETMADLRARDSAFLAATIPHSSLIERMGVTFKPVLAGRSGAPAAAALRSLCSAIWNKAEVCGGS